MIPIFATASQPVEPGWAMTRHHERWHPSAIITRDSVKIVFLMIQTFSFLYTNCFSSSCFLPPHRWYKTTVMLSIVFCSFFGNSMDVLHDSIISFLMWCLWIRDKLILAICNHDTLTQSLKTQPESATPVNCQSWMAYSIWWNDLW